MKFVSCSNNLSEVKVIRSDSKISSSLQLYVDVTIEVPLLDAWGKDNEIICLKSDTQTREILHQNQNVYSNADNNLIAENDNADGTSLLDLPPPVTTVPTNIKMKVSHWNYSVQGDKVTIGASLVGSACNKDDIDNDYVILLQVHYKRVFSCLLVNSKKRKVDAIDTTSNESVVENHITTSSSSSSSLSAPAVPTSVAAPAAAPVTTAEYLDPTVIQTFEEYQVIKHRLQSLQSEFASSMEGRVKCGTEKDSSAKSFDVDFEYPKFLERKIRIRILAFTPPWKEGSVHRKGVGNNHMEKHVGFLRRYDADNNEFAVFFPISGNTIPIPMDDIVYVYNDGAFLPTYRIPSVCYDIYGTGLPRAFDVVTENSFRSSVISSKKRGYFLLRCIKDDYKFHLCQIESSRVAGIVDNYLVKYIGGSNNIIDPERRTYEIAALYDNVLFYSDVRVQKDGLITGALAATLIRNKCSKWYRGYYNMLQFCL